MPVRRWVTAKLEPCLKAGAAHTLFNVGSIAHHAQLEIKLFRRVGRVAGISDFLPHSGHGYNWF